MATPEIEFTTAASPPASAQAAVVHGHASGFHAFLSAINPLQYLPVVGTIYRAITGDVIPESLREGGSMLVSGLMGGPIGLIVSIATTLVEKITGVDPEKIAAAVLSPTPAATVAHVEAPAAKPSTATPPVATPPTGRSLASVAPAPVQLPPPQGALTADQLSAYGVRTDASGILKRGDSEGADALNGVELVRLAEVAAAYAATQARSPARSPT
ncbi:MAG TPA: hypothetical protein VH023_00290 [Rhodopila sp.]|jgi:hypothetical protein|nr:hypothetical protein [Rhodopila sp.]